MAVSQIPWIDQADVHWMLLVVIVLGLTVAAIRWSSIRRTRMMSEGDSGVEGILNNESTPPFVYNPPIVCFDPWTGVYVVQEAWQNYPPGYDWQQHYAHSFKQWDTQFESNS